jgi:hypothetical protein
MSLIRNVGVPRKPRDTASRKLLSTSGDVQTRTRYGQFKFTVDGQEAELMTYADPHEFFMPFVDSLAGTETYGAGRYLEPEPLCNMVFQNSYVLHASSSAINQGDVYRVSRRIKLQVVI